MVDRTSSLPRHRGVVIAVGLLATLGVLMALSWSSASASPYCGGQDLVNFQRCNGAARTMKGVAGSGEQKSVCVGIGSFGFKCSGGPGEVTIFEVAGEVFNTPWIEDNAASLTIVSGQTFP